MAVNTGKCAYNRQSSSLAMALGSNAAESMIFPPLYFFSHLRLYKDHFLPHTMKANRSLVSPHFHLLVPRGP
jgi:hypothetical protein